MESIKGKCLPTPCPNLLSAPEDRCPFFQTFLSAFISIPIYTFMSWLFFRHSCDYIKYIALAFLPSATFRGYSFHVRTYHPPRLVKCCRGFQRRDVCDGFNHFCMEGPSICFQPVEITDAAAGRILGCVLVGG